MNEPVFNRADAVALYLTMVPRVGVKLAVMGAAARFGVCTDAIRRAVTSTAVREYLHAVGLSHEPALNIVIAAAKKFSISTDALQSAIDEHLLSVEAL